MRPPTHNRAYRALLISASLVVYVIAALAAAAAVAMVVWKLATDNGAVTEQFVHRNESSTASSWLRAGIKSLGKVPSLRLPSQDSRAIKVETVDVLDSVVWRETLQSTGDGLFVDMGRDSDADLVVNESHPYAKYLLQFDNFLLQLRSTGRRGVVAMLADSSPAKLERRIFRSIEKRRGANDRVYTLDARFARDKTASQAAYDLLFAVSTLRACYVNGEIIDGIMAALEDHAKTSSNNLESLTRILEKSEEDVTGTQTVLMGRMATEESRMANELADAVANVSDVEKAHAILEQRGIVSRGTRQTLIDKATAYELSDNELKNETVRAENILDDVVVKRSGLSTELDSAQIRSDSLTKARDEANSKSASQAASAQSDATRANAALGRNTVGLTTASRSKSSAEQRLKELHAKRAQAVASGESAQATIEDGRLATDRALGDIASARSTALRLQQQEGELKSNSNRTTQGARLTKKQMDDNLATSMRSSNNAQTTYALWDKYATLAKLADDLDANDDGLPK